MIVEAVLQLLLLLLTFVGLVYFSKRFRTMETISTSVQERRKKVVKSKNKAKRKKKKKATNLMGIDPDYFPPKPAEQQTETTNDYEEDSSDQDDGFNGIEEFEKHTFRQPIAMGRKAQQRPRVVQPPKLTIGQKIMARFENGQEWFPGTITNVQRGKVYTVEYDDGAVEYKVPERSIRTPTEFKDGDVNEEDAAVYSDENEEVESVEDDGWEVVMQKKTTKSKSPTRRIDPETGEEVLTKNQRNRRKQLARKREQKEALRAQAQEGQGLHARWGGRFNPAKKTD